ncbi:MAG: hypothetical protein L6R42_008843 [Xanthoria sp. 1 TBL-2021]|nr:MAG: hypothetical protein L6R42_008843 [Xanthoria sp. 1 TBL-2021]
MIEAFYHPRFALLLLFLCLFSIQRASSHALPANPQNPASNPSLRVQNVRAIERNVGNMVLGLAHNSHDTRYRDSKMVFAMFAVDHVVDEDLPDADRTHSNNIADFRDILCIFRYGGPPPIDPEHTEFWMKNRWPRHWEQWLPPQDRTERIMWLPFDWHWAVGQLSLGEADALLKANGHRGRYVRVALRETNLPGIQSTLAWCFHDVEIIGRENTNIAVQVLSRAVVVDAFC